MEFRQRFVPFGTAFSAVNGNPRSGPEQPSDHLYRNEIAVDVGSATWGRERNPGDDPEIRRIVDHHFERKDQYPSASAAVLHLDKKIASWAAALEDDTVWIATHLEPDFDALCAITLVEDIIRNGPAERDPFADGQWDWFAPQLWKTPPQHLWRYCVAAVASQTDQCREPQVPRTRTLAAFLYTCYKRGANLTSPEFRRHFFGVVEREIRSGRNALADSVLDVAPEFALERELLDRQEALYAIDLRRALKRVVSIPYDPHFAQTYRTLCQTPLLNAQGETEPAHLMEGCATVPVDGLFLRDPQCLLFKQFARQDTENSPSGRGFIFTAVVYSRDKNNEANQGNYFFSLDPEAIPGAHLYPLWTRLQERELGTIAKCEEEARWEFRARARGPKPGCFKDPWFDGGPYLATIVVTPGRGTSIGPAGTAADLSDDPVVRIATDLFEATQWSGRQYLGDYPSRPSGHLIPHPQTTNVLTEPRPLMDGAYRFVAIGLRPGCRLFDAGLGRDIARRLWGTLVPGVAGVPHDFDERHVLALPAAAGCWSRHGVAIAYLETEEGRRIRDRIEKVLEKMSALACKISLAVTNQVPKTDELRQLVLDVAELKWRVSEPEAKLAQRFFDATGFERELSLVYELYDAEASRGSLEQAGKSLRGMRRLQQSAAVLEIFIVVVYALEAAHLLSGLGAHESLFPVTLAYLVAGPLVIGALVYWQHHRQKRANLRWLAAGYVVLILVGAALAIYSRDENERKHGEQEDRVKVLMDRLAEKKESTKEK